MLGQAIFVANLAVMSKEGLDDLLCAGSRAAMTVSVAVSAKFIARRSGRQHLDRGGQGWTGDVSTVHRSTEVSAFTSH